MIVGVSAIGTPGGDPGSSAAAAPPGCGPGSSSSLSSSLSSPGFRNTSSFPFTTLRFFSVCSSLALVAFPPPPSAGLTPFARAFFFCLLARFFAVLASASSSRCLFLSSNSCKTNSCRAGQEPRRAVCKKAYLLGSVVDRFQSLILPPPACFINMELPASRTRTRTLYILHHFTRRAYRLLFWWWGDRCRLCGIF